MAKIGKLLFLFLLMLGFEQVKAQDVDVSATLNETIVFQGDRVVLTVTVGGKRFKNVSNPELPELNGLRYLTTTPSTSTNFSFVNGVAKSTYSYSYYLLTEKEGDYFVPEVKVEIDGKVYKTSPLKITVKGRTQAQDNTQNTPDIYLKLEVSNDKPFVGEQVVAKVVLYFKNNLEILSYQPVAGWKAEGFWKEELRDGKQPQAESAIINGMRYRKAELMKYALFPSKTGKLTISPFTVVTTVRVASRNRDPFSSFFGGFGTNQRNIDLETEPLEIEAQAVPRVKDATYLGAVGSFTVKRAITQNNALVGESIEVTTTVSGTGNIALVSKPTYEYPNTFEIYDPQETSSIDRKGDVVSGSKNFTDILIPRTPGNYEIPEMNVSYFNPQKKRHEVVKLPAIAMVIKRDPKATQLTSQVIPFNVQPALGLVVWTSKIPDEFYNEWWFFVILGFPLIGAVGLYFYRGYLDRMEDDVQFARSNKASKKADKRLIEAKKVAQTDVKAAYSALYKALVGYVADRAHVPETGESDEMYIKILHEKGLEEESLKPLKQLMDKCSTIRFAPAGTAADFEKDADLASDLLKKIRRVL
ncbi:protein BatD [bacterium]|nr:MAG: protein BatD [bacterium]